MTPEILARITAARAARDLSDLARQAVGATAETISPGERIQNARRLRKMANDIVDLVVLAEALAYADWREITAAVSPRMDPGAVEEEYADAVAEWAATTEAEADAAAAGFEDLDAWYARHREDHDPHVEKPVADLLNRH